MDNLKNFAENFNAFTKDIENTNSIAFDVLFDDEFMIKHTRFINIDDFLIKLGIDPSNEEEFNAFPQDKLDSFVKEMTNFSTWDEMQQSAFDSYILKKYRF